jgi:hypothetical protein
MRLAIVVVLVLFAAAARPVAADRPLPVFSVLNPADGAPVQSADLADVNAWLLIYTRKDCNACDQLLQLWTPQDTPTPLGRIRIVAGAVTPGEIAALREEFPLLTDAAWYADSDNSAAHALGLHGAPAVFGMRGQTVMWMSQGVLPITRALIAGWFR